MSETRYLPESDRIGVLASTVLLAYAITRIIRTPALDVGVQLPGFLLTLPLNINTAMSLLTAGITATGMDWLLRGHPSLHGRPTLQWWILPTLTSFVISLPLSLLPNGTPWWVGFIVSGTFLVLVFIAEYVAVDPGAPMYTTAVAGLTALSYALFFILTVALRYGDLRLFLVLPALFISSGLATLRILRLRLGDHWEYAWAFGIAFVCAQIAAGLHYWPLSPIQFGLMLTGPLYGLTNLAINLNEDLPPRRAALEPALATAFCWGLAIVIR